MTRDARQLDLTPARRWRIVQARDRRYDGAFVYAVRSTGIYCRPSCPSRRPRRAQVEFFPLPEVAERAGFRACRRCQPTAARSADPAVALVREACRLMDAEPGRRAGLAALAARVRTTPGRLVRAFRRVLGVTPRRYTDARRLARLKSQLQENRHVSPAIYAAGFSSPSRVYERTRSALGMTPATYARRGRGARIGFAVVPSTLGQVLVAATERGICQVSLGDDAAALERSLRAEFAAAEIRRDRAALAGAAARVVACIDGDALRVDLPLDIRATAFQRRVWEELRKIPRGATRSYADVARAVGRPRATRAVAGACARNPVAIAIPCHRVVRSDGAPGGYRWGEERKKRLIAREKGDRRPPLSPA